MGCNQLLTLFGSSECLLHGIKETSESRLPDEVSTRLAKDAVMINIRVPGLLTAFDAGEDA